MFFECFVSGERLHEVVVEFQAVTHHSLVVGTHVGDEVLEFALYALEGPDHFVEDVVLGDIFNWVLVVDDLVGQMHIRFHDLQVLLELCRFGVIATSRYTVAAAVAAPVHRHSLQ